MNSIKEKYIQNGLDFFTDEYYKVLELSKEIEDNNDTRKKTFRESDEDSVYQSIAIEIAQENHCQLSCEWCYINQMKRTKINKPLSFETVKDIIDKIVLYSKENNKKLFSNIVFIGGEPTLNNDLEKMIIYAIENGLEPIVVSNALKLSDMDYARKICREGVTVTAHIPFYKDNNEYDDKLDEFCKCKDYSFKLNKAIENMMEIRKHVNNFNIIGEFVVNKKTIDYAYNSYKYCRMHNITPFFELMRISDDSVTNTKLLLEKKDIVDLATKLYEYDREMHIIKDNNIMDKVRYYLPPTINSPCTIIQNSIHIKFTKDGFGNVASCCGQDIFHGNIQKDSLEKILKNKNDTKIFSKQHDYIQGPCSVCEIYYKVGCQGGCRGNSKNTYNCPRSSDPQCIFIKEEIKENAKIMANKNCAKCEITSCNNNINYSGIEIIRD